MDRMPRKISIQHWVWSQKEAVANGMVDRRGTPDWLIDVDWEARALMNRWLRKGMNVTDSMLQAGINSQEASLLQDMINGEVQSNDPRLNDLAAPIRAALEEVSNDALKFGLITEETHKRYAGAWLHRSYLNHEHETLSKGHRWLRRRLDVRRKKLQGDALKGRGIFWTVELPRLLKHVGEENPDWYSQRDPDLKGETFLILDKVRSDGRVYRRVYWPDSLDVPDKYANYTSRGTFAVRGTKRIRGKDKLILWRDYTREERIKMGEIMDARYVVARSFHTIANDLSQGYLYKTIADNPEATVDYENLSEEDKINFDNTYTVIPANQIPSTKKTWDFVGIDWIEVPKDTIAKSATPKWGKLAGKYVRPEVWRDLNEMVDMQRINGIRWLMSQFKQFKTVRSVKTHFRNFVSNFFLMDMMDVRWTDFRDALKAYAEKGKAYQEAMDQGVIKSNNLNHEMRKNYLEPLLRKVKDQTIAGQNDQQRMMSLVQEITAIPLKGMRWADEQAREAYQWEDDIFRFTAYLRRLNLGDTPAQAAAFARDQFINYDIRAPWVNFARNNFIPFVGYSYRLIPLLANAAIKRPWKLAKFYLLSQLFLTFSYWLDDGDEEEEYRALPEHLQGYTLLGIPKALRLGGRDKDGDPLFMDMSRLIPGGDIFGTGMSHSSIPMFEFLQFGGLAMQIVELLSNRETVTDKPIVNEETDRVGEKAVKILQHLYRSWMPNALYVPGSYDWNRVWNRPFEDPETGRVGTTASGKEYDFKTEFFNSLGISIRGRSTLDDQALQGMLLDRAKRELNASQSRLKTLYRNGDITRKELDERLNNLQRHLEALEERARKMQGRE